MALQSNANLRLLNGLLLVTPFFLSFFPVRNFAFISFCLYAVPPSVFGRSLSRLP
jgi:hypothetical protein